MNKTIKYIFILNLALAGMIFTACNTDFLNTKPLNQVSSEDVWKDAALSEAFVTDLYNGLGQGGFDEQMLASLSDEAVFTHPGRGIKVVNEGTLNPDNQGWVSGTYSWNSMYSRIRACNLALENLAKATFDDQTLNDRLRGESHFLRAYYYQQLLRYYGAVPIIDSSYGLGEDYSIARNTYEECVNFIVQECDSAAILLDGKTMDKGRCSKAAALALKSRVLLYAASDLHDIPTAKAKSSLIAGFAHPELLGYVSGDRIERWQKAKDAAKAVLDIPDYGYKLDLMAPVSPEEGKNNYISIAMGGGSKASVADPAAASELIFARYFTPNKSEGGQQQGLYNGPNGYHNWAGNEPIGELVDDYEMMDGSKFSWNDPAEAAHPYENRDPRFYASILYDGADWKPRNKISGNVDPANQIQSGHYENNNGEMMPGLDTRESSIENWNGSWSGYYCRKFIDPDPNLIDNTMRQYIPWPFFRYTEAIFNYVEACIHLNLEDEARTWLNKIRFRAGMPAITASGEALVKEYRNERQIEMAYEEQRYHDTRRWMTAPQTLGRLPEFIKVIGKLKPGKKAPVPYRHDEDIYTYTYTPVKDDALENRRWVDKMYFRPISRDEINRNEKLIQNPGY